MVLIKTAGQITMDINKREGGERGEREEYTLDRC